jgi:hypothetical protein
VPVTAGREGWLLRTPDIAIPIFELNERPKGECNTFYKKHLLPIR